MYFFNELVFDDIFPIFILFEIVLFVFLFITKLSEFKDDFTLGILLILMVFLSFIPIIHFYYYNIFKKLNSNIEYKFDPKLQTLYLTDWQNSKIVKGEIVHIEEYKAGGKWSYYFKIITLNNNLRLIFTDRLPFYNHFDEFFGENIPTSYKNVGFLDGYNLLKEFL